ncbi:MAG: hypothetical protein B7Y12_04620 [Rhizobiales bacterium 24-66-13]|jgi:hypothetical protein|nr:MAG: hypothetical protein B7Y95_02785 [Rhizobiales bacterium 32-66-11]OYY88656.1 MAG: hypothetical protein B7Y61_01635 [Rhizobiales bacterium 35-66-30]OYZ82156.1 MAG: hypothetical protein B7Y12_04620 [Rhizobiales bacterium 24-66-13]OZB07866.1 MAG: hypothetical protein B7X67_08530 [Rhizobiales bacterium 39-66-18]
MGATRHAAEGDAADFIHRLQTVLNRVELDCNCRQSLSEAIDRFTALERRRVSRRNLIQARAHKDRIIAMMTFLSELDQITEGENDRTVFEEMALLFVEIAVCANAGAAALRAVDQEI